MKTPQPLLVLALGLVVATSASAQGKKVVFPKHLKWQTMDLVSFNFNFPGYESTPAQRELAKSVWGETMASLPQNGPRGGPWPVFIIQTVIDAGAYRYVFSSLRTAGAVYPMCEDPPNSSAIETPIYAICSMRVVIQNKASGRTTQQDFPRYCTMTTNDSDQPKSRNYAQVALDAATNTAYFRVVQYGKPAPECNRAIKLPR